MKFPEQFKQIIDEKIVFPGDLADYFRELFEGLDKFGLTALWNETEKCWEIPHMIACDQYKKVVFIAIFNTADDNTGEGEFLLASYDNDYIMHLRAEMEEDVFFRHCLDIIQANSTDYRWESFLYDDKGEFQGFLLVERLDNPPPPKVKTVSRVFTDESS